MPTQEGPPDVISLACARLEDALAEGALTPAARAHAATCPRCATLARELTGAAPGALEDPALGGGSGGSGGSGGLLGDIQRATGPATLPPGFTDAVLRRALGEEAAAEPAAADPAPVPAPPRGRGPRWLGPALVAGLAAGLAVTAASALLGDLQEPSSPTPPQRVAVVAPAPGPAARPSPRPSTQQAASLQGFQRAEPSGAPAPLALQPAPEAPDVGPSSPSPTDAAPVGPPQAALPRAVPEPSLDVPRELRAALLREVQALDGCPAHTPEAVRVTLTVTPGGALTNRQVLSMGGDTEAHLCVNRALDRLLLPPLDRAATVTLDLRW